MKWIDILILILTILLMCSIIFFSLIYPRIKNKNSSCSSCPINKPAKIKRAFKKYKKQQKEKNTKIK